METFSIRAATDDDGLDLIELIGSVFGEYEGCVLDVDGEMPELRRIASHHRERGGMFWVAAAPSRIAGSIGYYLHDGALELKKLYLHRSARGSGLADTLLAEVEGAARRSNATRIELWSDTRFTRAHRFYEKRGYARDAVTRALGDLSRTVEYRFEKRIFSSA
jgi:GNAT superfamily N-acetyltransferase